MSARAIGSGTVSFGLVSIPVKIYSSNETSKSVSFNMLHAKCGTRVKQQYVCPTDDEVVPRSEMAKGYEFSKGQYVMLSEEEVKTLQEVATKSIDLVQFVPSAAVDPVYFEKTYYLGPDKGGEKAYRLLGRAMIESGLVGVAKYAARGKQYLVMVRPRSEGGLMMHQLRYPDEIKSFDEVPIADAPEASDAELGLATQIIEQIAKQAFEPAEFVDEVKERMLELIDQKIEGHEITAAPEASPKAQVIDLMEALKQSLGMSEDAALKPAAKKKAPRARKPTKAATKSKATAKAKKKKAAK